MFRTIRAGVIAGILASILATPLPASAEDEIPVVVSVVSAGSAPSIKASFASPIGKKSDGAKLSLSLSGLEPNRPVLFKVTPLPDAIARFDSDYSGVLSAKVELPYGLVPGLHELVADTIYGSDDTPASYTVGRFYVSDSGMLTNSDGTYPKGTRPVEVLTPNSAEAFETLPKYKAPAGSLRVSEPQLRVEQELVPKLTLGLTFDNSMTTPASFRAKITLFTFYGQQVGQPFYADLNSMAIGENRSVILAFGAVPAVGFFRVHTQLLLPNDFRSDTPVITSLDSNIFVLPLLPLLMLSLTLVLTFVAIRRVAIKRKRKVLA
jgi:hypothetical protein